MNELSPMPAAGDRNPIDAPLGWLRNEIDRLFDDFRRPVRSVFNFGMAGFGPTPAIELVEHDRDYRLTAELPGLTDEDIELAVGDGELILSGEKREQEERKDKGFMLSERRYGAFERRIALPADIDRDHIAAQFTKGVLEITLPKDAKAAGRTRHIAIRKG